MKKREMENKIKELEMFLKEMCQDININYASRSQLF